MTPEYAVDLLGCLASLCAIVALVWAARRRQLRTDDQSMYEAIADDEPDYTAGPSPRVVPRRTRWLFVGFFAVLMGLIGWMISETVRVATHAPALPPVTSESPSAH
jgi:hypothetical protein